MNRSQSEQLYQEALKHIVGGVNSPARSFKAVGGGAPVFMKRAQGAYFWDVDDNRYIDYLAAYGPHILGHAHPELVAAICQAVQFGSLYGTPTEYEIDFAKLLKEAIPSLHHVRFVNSGTEAVMSTIRIARAYTGRTKIVKFEGCYHGHSDWVLVAAGSGPSTLGVPDSAGVPPSIAKEVITVPFNDIEALRFAMQKWGEQIAAVLIEPIVGNFGMVMPHKGYLEQLCEITRGYGALVIYDEVISGFRFHYGGAQTYEGLPILEEMGKNSSQRIGSNRFAAIEPDLTALGKIIGGGLPIGAYGGRQEIMEQVAPLGPAYQAGTMAGNPASICAGIACLRVLQQAGVYTHLEQLAARLTTGIAEIAKHHQIELTINRIGGAFSIHFCSHLITNYAQASLADAEQFAHFFRLMLNQGINLAPSHYEAWFLTTAHTDEDIAYTLQAAEQAFRQMSRGT